MSGTAPVYGCIEAGGTKFVVGIAASPDDVRETARFDTATPDATIGAVIDWLKAASARHGSLAAIGIASFGPLELDRSAPNWGFITSTPKPGWANTDLANKIGGAISAPIGLDTDVNGAGLAEVRWGAGQGQHITVYVTVGTGIGGGVVVGGKPLIGQSHAEMGHLRPQRHAADLDFAGICAFHGACLEGLASGPAIKARWGASLSELPADHPGHAITAWYIAQLVNSLQAMLEPNRIILGGGVMDTPGLIERVRETAVRLGASYFRSRADQIVVPPALSDRAGLLGALALAMDAAQESGA
jgi:fructokinase